MRLLLVCETMSYFSGVPMYYYELARELRRQGHYVYLMTDSIHPDLKKGLMRAGVCMLPLSLHDLDIDVTIASERATEFFVGWYNKPTINVVHSEYPVEAPMTHHCVVHYIGIRDSIRSHLIDEYDIPEQAISVIPNGIDRTRFNPDNHIGGKGLLVPCTVDELREKFLAHIVAEMDIPVTIVGRDFGGRFDRTRATVLPETFDVEELYRYADEVAGILLGRVNLEAAACGVPNWIYDPASLERTPGPIWDDKYDITNVVDKIVKLAQMIV